jgi:hypothetical protein
MAFKTMEIRSLTQKMKEDVILGDNNSIIFKGPLEIWDKENLLTVIYAKINKLWEMMVVTVVKVFFLCYVVAACQQNRRSHSSNNSQVDKATIW